VGFFVEPADNARHPDPYAVIEDAYRLNRAAAQVLLDPPFPPRVEQTLADLRTLAQRDPENPELAFWTGRAQRTLGRVADAQASFQRALDLGGCDPEALLLLLRSATAGGDPAAAWSAFTRCREAMGPDRRILEAAATVADALPDAAAAASLRAEAARTPTRPPPGEVRTCR
jgi:Flp pilus assembly protein TadD